MMKTKQMMNRKMKKEQMMMNRKMRKDKKTMMINMTVMMKKVIPMKMTSVKMMNMNMIQKEMLHMMMLMMKKKKEEVKMKKTGARNGAAGALEWNASTRGEVGVHARNCRAHGRMRG